MITVLICQNNLENVHSKLVFGSGEQDSDILLKHYLMYRLFLHLFYSFFRVKIFLGHVNGSRLSSFMDPVLEIGGKGATGWQIS